MFGSTRKHRSIIAFPNIPLELMARAFSAAVGPARASTVGLDSTFVFLMKSLSKSICVELCIAPTFAVCDFTGIARCHMWI
jgi:hypothetical protein